MGVGRIDIPKEDRLTVPISEVHHRLSYWLRQVHKGPIIITRRGKAVGVLMDPQEYERLSQIRAYLQMARLSRSLSEGGPSAEELYRLSRADLEARA